MCVYEKRSAQIMRECLVHDFKAESFFMLEISSHQPMAYEFFLFSCPR